jgi:hypothetical protein
LRCFDTKRAPIPPASDFFALLLKRCLLIGRSEIAPSGGLRLARRARKPLREMRRRLWRDLTRLEAMRRGARGTAKFPVKSRKNFLF